ncbi:extensin family protein [Alphaproteobacteria bacterium]|nr:extensin family protein [Alphaproteobacteria bacterium]
MKFVRVVLAAAIISLVAAMLTWQLMPSSTKSYLKNVARPYANKLITLRKSRTVTNGPLCTKKLTGRDLEYQPVADRTNAKGCRISNAIRLSKVEGISLSKPATMTCEMALNLSTWVERFVQPEARRIFNQEVEKISHLGSYNCRTMRGNKTRLSQHAFANAFDVSGFTLSQGKALNLERDWNSGGKEQKFWRSIRKGACQNFDLVLGPDFDARHKDHFHLDAGFYKACL